jgi:colanic acid biosynthesis glycosyl transferase WcaI
MTSNPDTPERDPASRDTYGRAPGPQATRGMSLLVLCPHYAPDVAPTGEVMTRLGSELAERGHRLHVVTSLPWYEHHRVEPDWRGKPVRREETPWGAVTRVHPFPTDKRNIPARGLAFAGFTALATVKAITWPFPDGKPDAVFAMSPPLTLGVAGWLAARRWGVPYVFNIQDVFPDVAVELGAITNPLLIRVASALERWTYRHADAVTVLSEDLRQNVLAKLSGRTRDRVSGHAVSHEGGASHDRHPFHDRVRVIPNFVDSEVITPRHPERDPGTRAYREEHGLAGRRVVMYAGNVGLSQSLELMLEAARGLSDRSDAVFVINGGGAAREGLQRQAVGLDNVRFVDFQPRERLPEVLAAADIHVVPLKRGLARASVPSKTYSILAAGRPLVASVDEGTEVARLVERSGAGLAVPPDDSDAFVAAVTKLLDAPELVAEMGKAGRAFVEDWASPAATAQSYESLFRELRERRRRR